MLAKNKSRKFIDYAIEFLIVLLGITIAFWLSNIGERRKTKALEETYLQQLHEDLLDDISALKRTKANSEQKIAKLNEGISYIANHRKAIVPDSILQYAFLVGNYNFFYPSNHTYLTLQQSGDLAIIKNQELKKKLVALYQSYQLIQTEQVNLIQALDDNFFPEMYQSVDMITGEITNRAYFKSTQCTNFIKFTQQQTSQIDNLGKASEKLAQETVDLIELGLGSLKSIQNGPD